MNELALHTDKPTTFTMVPKSFEEAMKFAELMSDSDLVPTGYKGKPGNILVAIQKGMEVGLSPMAALETIAVINGRASLWGDGMLALVQAHHAYEAIDEGNSTEKEGVCRIKRKGEHWYEVRFTLDDAKRAGLLGKAGPWTQYQKRMLQLRARGFELRDKFADALKGMIAAEEAMDTVSIQAEVATPPVLTLKDKLKAQLEPITESPSEQAQGVPHGNAMVADQTNIGTATPEPPYQHQEFTVDGPGKKVTVTSHDLLVAEFCTGLRLCKDYKGAMAYYREWCNLHQGTPHDTDTVIADTFNEFIKAHKGPQKAKP